MSVPCWYYRYYTNCIYVHVSVYVLGKHVIKLHMQVMHNIYMFVDISWQTYHYCLETRESVSELEKNTAYT